MKQYLPFLFIAALFLLIKLPNVEIRLSDTNIYFYTGNQLLHGKILYKDIFFTNFPLLPYISALYILLLGGSLKFFYLTPVIEVLSTTFVMYLILLKQTKSLLLSALSSALYAFSFIILSTSDHQSGVFIASLFAIISYYFFLEKKLVLNGLFIALALLTKAYFLPIFLAFCFFHVLKGGGKWWQFFLGFFATIGIVLSPTLLLSRREFFHDVISYSLTRSQGVEKSRLVWFFITHDFLLFLLLVWSMVQIKKNVFFGVLSVTGIVFIFLYKDVYYLYMNFLIPFLSLSLPSLLLFLDRKIKLQKMIIPSMITIFLFINIGIYLRSFASLQKIDDLQSVISVIKNENPPVIYGTNDIAPALSYLTDIPLLENIIDTNPNLYRKGYLNSAELTKKALSQHAIFVGHGAYYPEYNVRQDITDEIFDQSQLPKTCRLIKSLPVTMEGQQNRLTLFRC